MDKCTRKENEYNTMSAAMTYTRAEMEAEFATRLATTQSAAQKTGLDWYLKHLFPIGGGGRIRCPIPNPPVGSLPPPA